MIMKHYLNTINHPLTKFAGQIQFVKDLLFPPPLPLVKNRGLTLDVDTHGHWLPGVDDGAQTTEEALTLVKGLSELGYRKLIATPHIMADCYGNEPEGLTKAFDSFQNAVREAEIKVELALAGEYMLDDGFVKHLDSGPLLTLKDRYVLVEMSLFQAFPALKEILFELQIKGYQPVLAHPERYGYFYGQWSALEELKSAGCLFQLNLLSLVGQYGKRTAEVARRLLREGLYEFAGTDVHNERQLKRLAGVVLTDAFHNEELV
jgi:protein-tyrosine phosphatase